jgi:hypothetical protein
MEHTLNLISEYLKINISILFFGVLAALFIMTMYMFILREHGESEYENKRKKLEKDARLLNLNNVIKKT